MGARRHRLVRACAGYRPGIGQFFRLARLKTSTLSLGGLMNTTEAIWSSVLSDVAGAITPEQFKTWFKDVSLLDASPEEATVRVPNAFYCKWFELHYESLIAAALGAALGARPAVKFEVAPRKLEPPAHSHLQPEQPPTQPRQPANSDLRLRRKYVFSSYVPGPSTQLAHAHALAVIEAPGLS